MILLPQVVTTGSLLEGAGETCSDVDPHRDAIGATVAACCIVMKIGLTNHDSSVKQLETVCKERKTSELIL